MASYRTQAILGQTDVDATWGDYLAELDRLGYHRMMDELEGLLPLEEMAEKYKQ